MDWPFVPANALLFWIALLLLVYVYVGYPIAAWLRALIWPRSHDRVPIEPTVTVVVVAHNEEDRIQGRLENLLALDYPRDKLEILVASDGSTDETVERARRFQDHDLCIWAFSKRRGKAAVLNDVVPTARGEIVILADARQRFDSGAARALVENFADPGVGAVSGELMLAPTHGPSAVGEGACFYWRYEKFIRRAESRAGSTVGATGAIYAIRKELFEPIAEDTILDDVVIPVRIGRQGYRVLLEPDARAYDSASTTAREEFTRKVRTIAGNFQLFARERWLFDPFQNNVWFEAISHKGLRLTAPVLQALVFVTNVGLIDLVMYRWTLAAQLLFYCAALGGYVLRQAERRIPLLTVPYTFCLLNWATIVAFVRFATNRQRATWERATPGRVLP